MLIKDNAVCIRCVDYSETSQIVTFFTRDTGKISAIAKGSRRPKSPFDGAIEMLSAGQIVFTSSDEPKLVTLTEFQQAPSPPMTDLYSLNCLYYACELVNSLTDEYDPHPLLFDSLLLDLLPSSFLNSYSSLVLTTLCSSESALPRRFQNVALSLG